METIYNVVPAQWAHEKLKGRQVKEHTPEDLQNPEFEPVIEEVELDTVIIVDRSGEDVFKFVFGEGLSQFLAHYVQFLSPEGRQVLRQALEETSGLVIPTISPSQLKLIPGGRE